MIRRRIYYSGNVQGVGFRYTAVRAAGGFKVAGYVRNMPDGRVEVVVEGEAAEVEAFERDLADAMRGYIIETETHSEPSTGQFSRFDVRY